MEPYQSRNALWPLEQLMKTAILFVMLAATSVFAQIGPTPTGSVGPTTWNGLQVYVMGNVVMQNGTIYQSLTNNNQANSPQGSPSAWTTVIGGAGGGAVSSVANSDNSLVISPTTGAVIASLNLAHPQTWTGLQTFGTNISIGGVTVTGATGTGNNVFSVSPALTGTPTAPTATVGTNTTQVATTAFVLANAGSGTVSSVFSRTGAVVANSGDYTVSQVTGAAPLASPVLTGTPTAPTATVGTNTTQLATTAFVLANQGGGGAVTSVANADGTLTTSPTTGAVVPSLNLAHANTWTAVQTFGTNISIGGVTVTGATGTGNNAFSISPTFTGTPLSTTASVGTNTTQIATTAYVLADASTTTPLIDGTGAVGTSTTFARADHVHPTDTSRAALASPTFTGTPAAPTAAVTTNTTQLATTAFDYLLFASPPSTGYGSTTPEPVAATTITATTSIGVGATPPTACGSATGCVALTEASTAATPTSGQDALRSNSTTHTIDATINGAASTAVIIPSTAACLAVAVPIAVPCIAYQSGPITGLTSTYTGPTITLYTSNAPAGAYFEFDITIIENANATGTVGGAPTLTFSAFTPPQLSSGNMNGYSFFNFPFQTQTYNIFDYGSFGVSTKSGTSLAFAMATASGTGTISWGYDIVVRRIY
jgi:hypothetical protein